MPVLTVVTPVRNGARFLEEALDSILRQTFRDFELLVVDDASTDGTPALLARVRDSRLRVLRSRVRLGPAAARNLALAHSTSEYVAFFDADDLTQPQRLETQASLLRSDESVGLVASRVEVMDAAGAPAGPDWGWSGSETLLAPTMLFRNVVPTSTVMVRRTAIAGEAFDVTLPVASDYDMWLRILNTWRAVVLPERLVRYRIHPANVTHSYRSEAEACMTRIAARQLTRLGISPAAHELSIHRALGDGRLRGARGDIESAERWLTALERANDGSRLYDSVAFARVIESEWLGACDAAASAGCWSAWRVLGRSALTRRAATGRPGRLAVVRACWRTLRSSIGRARRWAFEGIE